MCQFSVSKSVDVSNWSNPVAMRTGFEVGPGHRYLRVVLRQIRSEWRAEGLRRSQLASGGTGAETQNRLSMRCYGRGELFVGDTGTCRPSPRDHLGAGEAHLTTPAEEISGSEIEGSAELDQHVERHHQAKCVLTSGIIDEVLDDNKRAARSQCIVRRTDKVHFLLEIPIVKDHAHGNHI